MLTDKSSDKKLESISETEGTMANDTTCQIKIWKLRCKVLSEKYYSVIQDLKKDVSVLKKAVATEIEKKANEIRNDVLMKMSAFKLQKDQPIQQMSNQNEVI